MSTQSTIVAFLIGTIAIVSLMKSDCLALKEDEKGIKLCVTSRRGMKDLSHKSLTEVPSNLPNETQYLDISYNSIQRLTGAPFSRLSQLCFLKVTHCGLQEISPSVFSHTPALKVLNISYNDLPIIPDISLKHLKILDLANNLYNSYRIPASFQNLTNLHVLSLGSRAALSVNYNDFDLLMNVSLHHLVLGAGINWQKYDSGALAKFKSLQRISLFASFCRDFGMFENVLVDLNVTGATSLRFITVFPDNCNVSGNPFKSLTTMPFIQNLTIENMWINSSFMEAFLKNVWLSSLYDLSFVNITYNEDTLDGFQFRTINHTINLCSITFNGVNHYQYKYPTINMSFEAISNLTYLKFSGTGMNILPCNAISALPSLETLDLSDNLLTDSGFWWFQCSYTSVFPKLRQLSLSKNRFISLSFISEKTYQMKTLESLDLSFNSISLDGNCSWPAHLTDLSLGNNNLGNSVFQYLSPNFERIDLSKTGITAITQEDLSQFPKLTHLKLSSNSIQVIPTDLMAPALLSLHVDQNAITSISKEVLAGLPRLQTLKAGSNPFVCSCDSHWFVTNLNKSLLPDWPLDYTCSTPPSFAGLSLSEYKTSELSCETWLQATVTLPVVVVISAAIGLVFYKCDGVWYTKMLWVWIRVKKRGKKHSNMLNNVSYSYHAFISYSHQDAGWVDSQLVPSMEDSGFSLCVHERDFVPGDWIIDNIIKCVESSYKTLFVLSKHFVQSEWCNYELFFAQHRAISVQQDCLVFILLEPITAESLPKRFLRLRSLLRQQTYLEWPKDERKQQVFWASLKSMLHMADKSMVLKDVALAISDTVPLVTDQV
ncbi:toll-like receptor 1 isoform X1 [Dicentrarchus labrax]|uniref:TIR domain-containing protein n=1 Tax=Dicentrarchus labrax TaxID=13489 RepID=A0A8P4GN65_DICLA|nr:toll-like receptor 1 isoform X1 [Dicentrarchus labrax]